MSNKLFSNKSSKYALGDVIFKKILNLSLDEKLQSIYNNSSGENVSFMNKLILKMPNK